MTSLRAVSSDNVEDDVHPLVQLMRRYVFAYTCCHDFSECRRVMVDDYVLCMGEHRLTGCDGQYTEATAKQFRQFPGLGRDRDGRLCRVTGSTGADRHCEPVPQLR